MTVTLTYTDDHARPYGDPLGARPYVDAPAAQAEEPYVPVYARGKSRKARRSGMRSWMILAPVGVLVLGGAAAMMLMGDGRDAPALAEPAATAPVVPAAPAALAPATAPAPVEAAPLVRDSAPAARAAPVRRAAAAPAPARRVEAAPAPARATTAATAADTTVETSDATVTLNTAPTTTAAPPPPRIVVAPLD